MVGAGIEESPGAVGTQKRCLTPLGGVREGLL